MGRARCEWGLAGVAALRGEVAVLVVVDVLSFSTAVDVAVARGASIVPFASSDLDGARQAAERTGAALASRRRAGGPFSLSPASFAAVAAGATVLLPSPNGSRLSLAGGGVPVLTGCLRNASAVAGAARRIAGDGAVGVVPAGERWPDGSLRPAIEDLLGAGAILDRLDLDCTAEARVARDAFRAARDSLAQVVGGCVSGRELTARGYGGDVAIAVDYDVSPAAPLLIDGRYQAAG